jgi:hypothetical protein
MSDVTFITVIDDNITRLIHKNLNAKFDDNIEIKLNNLDFRFNSQKMKANDQKYIFDTNITIKTNQCSLVYDNHKLLSDSAIITIKDNNSIKIKSYKNSSRLDFYLKDDLYYFKGVDFDDDTINALVGKKMFKKGKISFQGYQRKDIVSGALNLRKTIIKDVKLFNNLFAFINTAPAIVNPLLAVPNLLNSKNLGFSSSGYRVKSGEVLFDYDLNNTICDMSSIRLKADSADINGVGVIDFENNNLNLKLGVSFLKTYSNVIKKIPLVGYIMLGKNGTISLNLDAIGSINNPKIKTHLVKDTSRLPFKMTKRILLSPFELFGVNVD